MWPSVWLHFVIYKLCNLILSVLIKCSLMGYKAIWEFGQTLRQSDLSPCVALKLVYLFSLAISHLTMPWCSTKSRILSA